MALRGQSPPLARIDSIEAVEVEIIPNECDFLIVASRTNDKGFTSIAPDTCVCELCLTEMLHPQDRRYRYPFINCTNCGPRYTIIQKLPYDRPNTTMRKFRMCEACEGEYTSSDNRRYHAQPNACHECGPTVWFTDSNCSYPEFERPESIDFNDAIERCRAAIQSGKIVAIKGIGGFHLACDATNHEAVQTLRERKKRDSKPFAVMVRDIETCKSIAEVDDNSKMLLQSLERPIVLLPKKRMMPSNDWVAPGNDFLGVMLCYAPLHYLLMEAGDVWVMTSGNVSDEPIECDNRHAWTKLSTIADAFLFHDRDIETVCDDSVVRVLENQIVPVRRARGYSPLPIELSYDGPSAFAVGGELKAAIGFANARGQS
ncbi:MAG: Sua5/YciO/YrdC/YwlC family protein [Pirellulaceae bacterium]